MATAGPLDAPADGDTGAPRPPPSKRSRLLRLWRPARYVVGVGLGAVALFALNGQRGELTGATGQLTRLHLPWLALAVIVEVASLACFAAMQGWLLDRGGVKVGWTRMFAITIGAGAIASSLPAGPAVSSVFAYHQYRRRGADDAMAVWTLIATLTCAALALAFVATAGLLVAQQQGASLDLIGVTIGVLLVSVVGWLAVAQRKWLVAAAGGAIHLAERLTGYPRRHSADVAEAILARLETVHLNFRDLAVAIGWALGNWCFDCACLAFCFAAVSADVPWRGLLLAYGAAQLAANLPITPGGLGVVEGSLTIALVAYGGVEYTTVAAVLLYRIISFWGFIPFGWAGWGALTWHNRVIDHRAGERSRAGQTAAAAAAASTGEPPQVGSASAAAGDLERSSS